MNKPSIERCEHCEHSYRQHRDDYVGYWVEDRAVCSACKKCDRVVDSIVWEARGSSWIPESSKP